MEKTKGTEMGKLERVNRKKDLNLNSFRGLILAVNFRTDF